MAKKDESKDESDDVQRQMDFIARGEQVEGGWCIDFDRNPPVYKCSDEEEAVARGDISVSVAGDKVTDLKSGEVTEREADWSKFNPTGAVDLADGTPVASSPTGGGGRGPVASGGNGGNVNG